MEDSSDVKDKIIDRVERDIPGGFDSTKDISGGFDSTKGLFMRKSIKHKKSKR